MDLLKSLLGGDEVCPVCRTAFKSGKGVVGESENVDGLTGPDRPEDIIEFCSVECRNTYYASGRERKE